MSPEEKDLISRIVLSDDRRAFDLLVRKYQHEIRNLLHKLTCGDSALTDDLSQEVFIRVFRHLRQYRGDAKFSTWLYRIAVRVFYAHRRSLKRFRDAGVEALHDDQGVEMLHDDQPVWQQKIDIHKALGILNAKERASIVLCYEKGFSHSEIAAIMHMPLGTVKSNILRGKEKLKKYFSYDEER